MLAASSASSPCLLSVRSGRHEFDGIGRLPLDAALLEEPSLAGPRLVHAVRDPGIVLKVRRRRAQLGLRGVSATGPLLPEEPLPCNPVG